MGKIDLTKVTIRSKSNQQVVRDFILTLKEDEAYSFVEAREMLKVSSDAVRKMAVEMKAFVHIVLDGDVNITKCICHPETAKKYGFK